jgi:holo-[acyl-carrier protein] synthase
MGKNKIGCDIVYIPRIRKIMGDENLIKKVFNHIEIERFDAEHLAGVFAAKEAVLKTLNIYPMPSMQNVTILYEESGRPYVKLSQDISPKNSYTLDISISHDTDYAFAVAILFQEY